jgi:hypothetical protein
METSKETDLKWVPEWASHFTIKSEDDGRAVCVEFYMSETQLTTHPIEKLPAMLSRRDVGQQIRDNPLADRMPKQERYHSANTAGTKDFIDESYETESFADFTAAIFWTMKKYMKRFGKKDDIVAEAYKIKDYSTRLYEKVVIEAAKRKKIDERA